VNNKGSKTRNLGVVTGHNKTSTGSKGQPVENESKDLEKVLQAPFKTLLTKTKQVFLTVSQKID
jgi:hypothetical protein